MNRLIAAIAAILLIGGGGALAIASTGGPAGGGGGNAAITQYEPKTPEHGVENEQAQHNGPGHKKNHEVEGTNEGGGAPPSGNAGAGTAPVSTASTGPAGGAAGLPFTGLDVLALGAVGLLLLLAGIGQRRFGASRRHTP